MRTLLDLLEQKTGVKTPNLKMPYGVALMAGVIDTKLIATVTGHPPKAPLTGVRLAGRQVSFSSAKAAKKLQWEASPFEPALDQMIEWLAAEGLYSR